MGELVETIVLSGFDPAGEPEIRVMPDGTLHVVFNFMPPSDAEDREQPFFDHFDEELQSAISTPVVWEDRERFVIRSPEKDTIERLRAFIATCRSNRGRGRPRSNRGVRTAIRDTLDPVVAAKGFRFDKQDNGYVRTIHGGKQILFAPVNAYQAVYNLSFTLGIQLNAVVAIVQGFGGSGMTLTQLEYFGLESARPWGAGFWMTRPGVDVNEDVLETGRLQGFWSKPDHLKATLQKATSLIDEKLLPFFDRYQDAESIDQALHGEPRRGTAESGWWHRVASKLFKARTQENADAWLSRRRSFDSTDHPNRALTAIAIAYLARNQRFEVLAKEYRADMATLADAEGQTFDKLVQGLRARADPG